MLYHLEKFDFQLISIFLTTACKFSKVLIKQAHREFGDARLSYQIILAMNWNPVGYEMNNYKNSNLKHDIPLCYELKNNPFWFRQTQPNFI